MRKTINVKNLLNTDGALTQGGGKDCQGSGQAPECFSIFKKITKVGRVIQLLDTYILAPIQ